MRDLPKNEIEALLPVAVALGFYKAWAVTFAGLYETPPGWLTLPDEGRSFVGSLSSFLAASVEFTGRVRRTSFWSDWHWSDLSGSRSVGQDWSSRGWGSFSGGWSGGGGFSGGGFGGGGGGGW